MAVDNRNLFFIVLETGKSKTEVPQIWGLVRAGVFIDGVSPCDLTQGKRQGTGHKSIHKGSTLMAELPHKDRTLKYIWN